MGISFNAASLLNGNGIDVTSVVSQIQSQESGQLTQWQQQQQTLQTQASDLSSINSSLASLQTAVQSLSDVLGPLSAMTANSSLPAVLTATATSSASAGTHTVTVSGLASAGAVYTDAVSDENASILPSGASSGDIELRIGVSSGTLQDIQINANNNDTTLSSLATYIDQQSSANNWGVTASVLQDASGYRLAIYSQNTGTPGALSINGNTGLTPANSTGNTTTLSFEAPVGGADATVTVDGIPYSSTSNTVTNAIPGVTLNLVSSYSGQVQVSIGTDSSQATQAISSFVTAYNAVLDAINQQFTVDPTSNTEGPLGSDSSLRSLQSSLLSDATYAVNGNNGLVNLESLGISMNDDGTLAVDSTTLNNAMSSNPTAFLNFFQNTALTGFANQFSKDLTSLTDPTTGVLNSDLAQNQSEQTDLTNQINDFQDQLATQKQQLISEFSQVNASLEEYPYLLQEVTTMLGYSTPNNNTSPQTGSAVGSGSSSSSTDGTTS